MFEEFYQKYETEEQEVIALICKCIGAGYHKSDNSDFWEMTVITLGMVFCNTGKVSIKEPGSVSLSGGTPHADSQ